MRHLTRFLNGLHTFTADLPKSLINSTYPLYTLSSGGTDFFAKKLYAHREGLLDGFYSLLNHILSYCREHPSAVLFLFAFLFAFLYITRFLVRSLTQLAVASIKTAFLVLVCSFVTVCIIFCFGSVSHLFLCWV